MVTDLSQAFQMSINCSVLCFSCQLPPAQHRDGYKASFYSPSHLTPANLYILPPGWLGHFASIQQRRQTLRKATHPAFSKPTYCVLACCDRTVILPSTGIHPLPTSLGPVVYQKPGLSSGVSFLLMEGLEEPWNQYGQYGVFTNSRMTRTQLCVWHLGDAE